MGQNPTDSEVNDMLNEVDVDGSGVVEYEEFVNFFARLMKNRNPQNEIREAFRRFVQCSVFLTTNTQFQSQNISQYNEY